MAAFLDEMVDATIVHLSKTTPKTTQWGVFSVRVGSQVISVNGNWPWPVLDISEGTRLLLSISDTAQPSAWGTQHRIKQAMLHPDTPHLGAVSKLLGAGIRTDVAQKLCAALQLQQSSGQEGCGAGLEEGAVWAALARMKAGDDWSPLRRAGIPAAQLRKVKELDSAGAAFRMEALRVFPTLAPHQLKLLCALAPDSDVAALRPYTDNPFRLWALGVVKTYEDACALAMTLRVGPGDPRWEEAYLVHAMQRKTGITSTSHRQVCVPLRLFAAEHPMYKETLQAAVDCGMLAFDVEAVRCRIRDEQERGENMAKSEADDVVVNEGLLYSRLSTFRLHMVHDCVYLQNALDSENKIIECVRHLCAQEPVVLYGGSRSSGGGGGGQRGKGGGGGGGRKASQGEEEGEEEDTPDDADDADLNEQQRAALRMLLSEHVCMLTGGAGTGKTRVVHSAARAIQRQGGCILMVAPTGAAVLRMMAGVEPSDTVDTQTISRVLVTAKHTRKVPFAGCKPLVIVDEASMMDVHLCGALFELARTHSWRLALTGDPRQLPPVGPGSPFASLLECARDGSGSTAHHPPTSSSHDCGGGGGAAAGAASSSRQQARGIIPHVHLSQTMRTAHTGLAVSRAAEQVLAGQVPIDERSAGFRVDFLPNTLDATLVAAARAAATDMRQSPGAPIPQFLASTNEVCLTLNKELRAMMTVARPPPAEAAAAGVVGGGEGGVPYQLSDKAWWVFKVGDLVALQKNRYSQAEPKALLAANGSRGRVHEVRLSDRGKVESLDVSLVDVYGADVFKASGERSILRYWHDPPEESLKRSCRISHLRPAYCITVHKSQGSEYRSVVYVGSGFGMTNSFLYTAITRASHQCRILTTPAFISMAASTVEAAPLDHIAASIQSEEEPGCLAEWRQRRKRAPAGMARSAGAEDLDVDMESA